MQNKDGNRAKNATVKGTPTTPLSLWGNKAATSALDWSSVNRNLVVCALAAAQAADAALMFGVAQGGRGIVLTAFLGSQRGKTYVATVEELEAALEEFIVGFSSTSEDLLTAFGLTPS